MATKINSREIRERSNKINGAWKDAAAAAKFGGISQTDFQKAIGEGAAIDAAIADLEAQLKLKQDERDIKYGEIDQKSVMVRNGVVADPAYGDDSPLYGAMGFVRKSERRSGLTRKKDSNGAKS